MIILASKSGSIDGLGMTAAANRQGTAASESRWYNGMSKYDDSPD